MHFKLRNISAGELMDNTDQFIEFSKQSSKGILIIYINSLYKLLKVTWLLLIIFFRNISNFSEIGYLYTGTTLLFLLLLLRAFLLFKNFQFKISNDHFILKQGIFTKVNTSISFDRIQNINFKQNLIQQLIGVYEVSIETAGSNKIEIVIKALTYKKAQKLKQALSLKEKTTQDNLEVLKDKPLLKISSFELFKVGLTENHFRSLAIFLAILIGFFQQLRDIIENFGEINYLDNYFEQGAEVVYGSVMLIVILLIILVFVGVISSFIRVFLFHFNLNVFVKNETFEINQGLLTKKSIVLKKDKVQTITISTNPLKQLLGISFITFRQAVSGIKNKKKKDKDKMIKIVGCKSNQIKIIKDLLFNTQKIESEEKHLSDSYYKTRMYIRSSIFLLLINLILYIGNQYVSILVINIFSLPIFGFLIALKYKKTFYKFTDDLLLLGSGSLETHFTYLPFFKVQNIKMKQNFFQKRRDVVDLVFQTAAGKVTMPCIKKERATKIYNYTLYKVESSNEPWM